jgi:hypothetical protein
MANDNASRISIVLHLLGALTVLVLEAFVRDGWTLGLVLTVFFVVLFVRQYKRFPFRDSRAMAWPVMFLALVGMRIVNNEYTERQGQRIAAACDAYKAAHGDYPRRLADLVPGQLEAIPIGRLTLRGRWSYGPPLGGRQTPLLVINANIYDAHEFDFRTHRIRSMSAF